mgnify:CR=1 FL=1
MEMVNVTSSNIAAVGYEAETLTVRFRNGGEYRYSKVPVGVYAALMAAESKGGYLARFVARKYPFVKVVQPEKPAEPTA